MSHAYMGFKIFVLPVYIALSINENSEMKMSLIQKLLSSNCIKTLL
jgi:hypothetical protein